MRCSNARTATRRVSSTSMTLAEATSRHRPRANLPPPLPPPPPPPPHLSPSLAGHTEVMGAVAATAVGAAAAVEEEVEWEDEDDSGDNDEFDEVPRGEAIGMLDRVSSSMKAIK